MCSREKRKEKSGWWRSKNDKNEKPSFLSRLLFSSSSSPRSSFSSQYDCGEEATRSLRSLVARKNLRCDRKGMDRYGRALARCFVDARGGRLFTLFSGLSRDRGNDNSIDVGEWMIRQGQAVFYSPTGGVRGATRETTSRYLEAESRAKRELLGIWSGTFEDPSAWRKRRRLEREREGKAKKKREAREQERKRKAKKQAKKKKKKKTK